MKRRRRKRIWVLIGGVSGFIGIIALLVAFGQLSFDVFNARDSESTDATRERLEQEENELLEMLVTQSALIASNPLPATATSAAERIAQIEGTLEVVQNQLSQSESNLESTPESIERTIQTSEQLPLGDWSVRAFNIDDANIILVNEHIVGGNFYRQVVDWIPVNSYFRSDGPNYVSFVALNGPSGATWGFSLRNNENIVWGNENSTSGRGMVFFQTVEILPPPLSEVQEVNLQDFSKTSLEGEWTARISANDLGVLMINGIPVAGDYRNNNVGEWVNISHLMYEGQDNIISVSIWNNEGDYSWDIALRKNETVIWGNENHGSGQTGEVYFTSVIINEAGQLVR